MTIEQKDSNLVITLAINSDFPVSASGKTLQVASSHGNIPTAIIINGEPEVVSVGVNCFMKNPAHVK